LDLIRFRRELATLHLVKSYCLTTLLYRCETWSFTEKELHKASVAWNNSFRRMFSCCWRESVRPKPLQYYCQSLPYLILSVNVGFYFGVKC